MTEEELLLLKQQQEAEQQPLEEQVQLAKMNAQATPQLTNLQQLQQYAQDSRNQQANEMRLLKDYMNKYAGSEQQKDWRPLAAWAANLTGNKGLLDTANSMAPESADQKTKNLIDLQQKFAKLTGDNASQNQLMKIYQGNQKLDMERMRALRGDRSLGLREDQFQENNVQKLMNSMGKVNATLISQKISRLNENIPGGIYGDGDIPGVGVAQKWAPGYILTDEGSKIRQDAIALLTETIKASTGLTATDAERLATEKITGLAASSTATQFRNGLKNLLNDNIANFKSTQAGYSPQVQGIYKERGGVSADRLESIIKGGGGDGVKEWNGKKYKIDGNRWVEVK